MQLYVPVSAVLVALPRTYLLSALLPNPYKNPMTPATPVKPSQKHYRTRMKDLRNPPFTTLAETLDPSSNPKV